jgi:hypothetical protein
MSAEDKPKSAHLNAEPCFLVTRVGQVVALPLAHAHPGRG